MKVHGYDLKELAHLIQGELFAQRNLCVAGLASLEKATPTDVAFVKSDKYLNVAKLSKAGVLIVPAELKSKLIDKHNVIVVAHPYLSFAQLTHFFEKKIKKRGIESTAQIHPSALISPHAYIGHYVVIGEGCIVKDHTIVFSHSVLDDYVQVGESCFIEAHVTLTGQATIKDRVRIHANTVVGGEGFGFAPMQNKWHRIAQLGSVQIGNDVRIGSNCSIDRGALDDTILEDGVIIDNLVQIAHNVKIGSNTAIAAKTAVAGSTTIGKNCVIGGDCGLTGHITITDNVTLTGMSMVTKNISEPGVYSSGTGLFKNSHWKRTIVRFRQLADLPLTQILKRIDDMHTRLESLESTFKLRK